METPELSKAVTLRQIVPRMAHHPDVRRLLADQLPQYPLDDLIARMERGDTAGEPGADLHDTITDAIDNLARTVWSGSRETDWDTYGFEVTEFAGAFVVRATDLDSIGYFVSTGDAIAYIRVEYPDVEEET
jgi:hypothetical protein